jgi:hypothetical protein
MEPPRTATWLEEHTPEGRPFTLKNRHWLCLDPPAMAWLTDLGDHNLIDGRGQLHTSRDWDSTLLSPLPKPWTQAEFLRKILPWGWFPPDLAERLGEGGTHGGWQSARDAVDGQPAWRFDRRFVSRQYRVDVTIWCADNGLLLREEKVETEPGTGVVGMRTVKHGFEYDVQPPEHVFILPTPDKPLKAPPSEPMFRDVTESLPPGERGEIERVIAASNAAWQAGDFDPFARVWQFPANHEDTPLRKQAEWEHQVREQARLWTRWECTIERITQADVIGVAFSTGAFKMVPAPGVLWARCRLRVEWKDGTQTWEGDADYYIRKNEDGYRLIHWEYPSAEVLAARRGDPDTRM